LFYFILNGSKDLNIQNNIVNFFEEIMTFLLPLHVHVEYVKYQSEFCTKHFTFPLLTKFDDFIVYAGAVCGLLILDYK